MASRKERGIFFRPSPTGSQLHQGQRGDWWIRYVDQYGRLHREKVGPKSLAKEVYRKRKTAIREGRFFPERLKQRSILFDEAAKDWLNHAKVNKRTWRDDEEKLPRLLEAFGGKALAEITVQDAERFKVNLAERFTPATVNRYLALLKAIFYRAIKAEKSEGNPVRGIKLLKENNARTRCLSEDEERRLLACSSPSLRPVLTLALHTGMRLGELLALRWEDVDFYTGTLTIRRAKSGEGRRVPMNAVVRETLADLRRERVQAARQSGEREILSPHVFCSPEGHQWQNFYRDWYKALKHAEIRDLRPHDLRHTFASRLVMAGVDLLTVKELLGHKTLAMTLRYSYLSPTHQRQVVERLTPGETDTKTDTRGLVGGDVFTQKL